MKAQYTEQDIDSYIDALLYPEPFGNSRTFSLEPSHLPEETPPTPKEEGSKDILQIPIIKELPSSPTLKRQSQSGESSSSKSKDYLKNMYNNSLKFIVKRYISTNYIKQVEKIHKRLKIKDSHLAKLYYKQRQEQTIGLTNLCDLLNYNEGSEDEKIYKKAFHIFYVWFMRKCYPIHILTTGKLQHPDVYWRAKNLLIYLPDLKKSQLKAPPTLCQQISSISLTQVSFNPTV